MGEDNRVVFGNESVVEWVERVGTYKSKHFGQLKCETQCSLHSCRMPVMLDGGDFISM